MEAALQKAIAALAETPDDYVALAQVRRILLSSGRYWALARTMQWWAAQVTTAPERAEGYFAAADAVLMATPEARETVCALLRQALHQDPRHRPALYRLERLCRQSGDVRALREALSLVVADAQKRELPPMHYAHILEHLARVYAHDLEQPQRATDCYREILRLVPEHEEAPRQLAHLLVDRKLGPRPVPPLGAIDEAAHGPGDLYAAMNAAEQQQAIEVEPFVAEYTTRPKPIPAAPAVVVPDVEEDDSCTNLISRNALIHEMPTGVPNLAIDVDFGEDEATMLRESPTLQEEQDGAERTRRLERPLAPLTAAAPGGAAGTDTAPAAGTHTAPTAGNKAAPAAATHAAPAAPKSANAQALPEPKTVRLNRPLPAPLKRKRVEPPPAKAAPIVEDRTVVSEPPPAAEPAPHPTVPPKRRAGRQG